MVAKSSIAIFGAFIGTIVCFYQFVNIIVTNWADLGRFEPVNADSHHHGITTDGGITNGITNPFQSEATLASYSGSAMRRSMDIRPKKPFSFGAVSRNCDHL